jgi:hypothetical protein
MPYSEEEEEIIIRNGTLRQWLNYVVVPHKLKGWWIVAAVAVIAFVIGKLF